MKAIAWIMRGGKTERTVVGESVGTLVTGDMVVGAKVTGVAVGAPVGTRVEGA